MDTEKHRPLPDAFSPHRTSDSTGISVYRLQFHTAAEIAGFRTLGTAPVWVAYIRLASIREIGLDVIPDRIAATSLLPAQEGHALLPQLDSAHRDSDEVASWKRLLLSAVFQVDGPFDPPAAPRR